MPTMSKKSLARGRLVVLGVPVLATLVFCSVVIVGVCVPVRECGNVERAEMVLVCVESMQIGAPLEVTEAHPDYGYEAALIWCDKFVGRGGRGFGGFVLKEGD